MLLVITGMLNRVIARRMGIISSNLPNNVAGLATIRFHGRPEVWRLRLREKASPKSGDSGYEKK